MEGPLADRIRQAVARGMEARAEYYGAIDLPNGQQLGPPVEPSKLLQLEERTGLVLPPSYRTFLSLHDGWRMVDGATDLLSVQEMLEGPRQRKIKKWQEQARRTGDSVAANSLVIGSSDITPTRLLLDPESMDSEGEWRVVQHHKAEEYDYPSFLDWLEESAEDFRQLAREERESGTRRMSQ